jgi:hypothetical protein
MASAHSGVIVGRFWVDFEAALHYIWQMRTHRVRHQKALLIAGGPHWHRISKPGSRAVTGAWGHAWHSMARLVAVVAAAVRS